MYPGRAVLMCTRLEGMTDREREKEREDLQVLRALDDGQLAELRFFYEKDREPLS